jgi:hypothetical protein
MLPWTVSTTPDDVSLHEDIGGWNPDGENLKRFVEGACHGAVSGFCEASQAQSNGYP